MALSGLDFEQMARGLLNSDTFKLTRQAAVEQGAKLDMSKLFSAMASMCSGNGQSQDLIVLALVMQVCSESATVQQVLPPAPAGGPQGAVAMVPLAPTFAAPPQQPNMVPEPPQPQLLAPNPAAGPEWNFQQPVPSNQGLMSVGAPVVAVPQYQPSIGQPMGFNSGMDGQMVYNNIEDPPAPAMGLPPLHSPREPLGGHTSLADFDSFVRSVVPGNSVEDEVLDRLLAMALGNNDRFPRERIPDVYKDLRICRRLREILDTSRSRFITALQRLQECDFRRFNNLDYPGRVDVVIKEFQATLPPLAASAPGRERDRERDHWLPGSGLRGDGPAMLPVGRGVRGGSVADRARVHDGDGGRERERDRVRGRSRERSRDKERDPGADRGPGKERRELRERERDTAGREPRERVAGMAPDR